MRTHPARYALVELVNLYDETVVLHALHRAVTEIEPDALCDYFMRKTKCRRESNLLYPVANTAETVKICDEILAEFARQNGGKIDYVQGEDALKKIIGEDGVGIVLTAPEKDGFFDRFKGGRKYPKRAFTVGKEREKRYYMEGREISYD